MEGKFTWAPKRPAIYTIRNTVNSKIYIGSTWNLRKRFKTHVDLLRTARHFNKHLQSAWTKYGEDSFAFEVLEMGLTKANIIERENFWISALLPGYNKSSAIAGMLGYKHSQDFADRLRARRLGTKHTEEAKAKISAALIGIPKSPEMRRKLSASKTGVPETMSPEIRSRLNAMTAARQTRTTCKKGLHALSGTNVAYKDSQQTKRYCRLCFNDNLKRYRHDKGISKTYNK